MKTPLTHARSAPGAGRPKLLRMQKWTISLLLWQRVREQTRRSAMLKAEEIGRAAVGPLQSIRQRPPT